MTNNNICDHTKYEMTTKRLIEIQNVSLKPYGYRLVSSVILDIPVCFIPLFWNLYFNEFLRLFF